MTAGEAATTLAKMTSRKRVVLEKIHNAWGGFKATFAEVPPLRIDEAGVVEKWSVKDLIGHIASWDKQLMTIVGGFLERRDGDIGRLIDVDAFNERTVQNNRAHSVADLLRDLETTHDRMVQFVWGLPQEDFDLHEVQWRIQIDTYEHYSEHAQHISDWLGEGSP